LKTDAVIITTYPSAAEFFSIPQCLKTCIDYWANFIYTSNNQFLSININPLSQFLSAKWRHGLELSERYMLYLNSCSAPQLFVLVLNVRIMFELRGCCFAKLQPVKDAELKESADRPFRLLSDLFHLASSHYIS